MAIKKIPATLYGNNKREKPCSCENIILDEEKSSETRGNTNRLHLK